MASLAFLAGAGLLLNLAIGRYYGPAALGLFNIVFALYIFVSQFSVFGIHLSVLKYVSEYVAKDTGKTDAVITGGLMLAAVCSSIAGLAAWLATPLVVTFYQVEGIRTAWLVLLPGLWCFSFNKVLLNAINGAEHMRALAALLALRYALILCALATVILLGIRQEVLSGVIAAAEILLTPVLLCYSRRIVSRWDWTGGLGWMRPHFAFGVRAFPSGAVGELNTRVDVLMIGAMMDGAKAGVYSLALLLAEGLGQAIVVVRNNLNPILTRLIVEERTDELAVFCRRLSAWFMLFMAVAGLVVVAGLWAIIHLFLVDVRFHDAIVPLAIWLADSCCHHLTRHLV